jgi:hypothetical protein
LRLFWRSSIVTPVPPTKRLDAVKAPTRNNPDITMEDY